VLKRASAVTATRIVVRGATTAITRRTNLRKAFLAPWDPLVQQCWLYALADAQRLLGFALHHTVLNVTHHHTSATLEEPVLGEITRRVHHDMSCAINTLLAHERYDAPRNVFDGRQAHCMRLVDAAAQASHLTYEYLNPVAAGLVARPEDMPGVVLDWGHWKSGGIAVRRPKVYFGKSRPEELWLELTPPPRLMRAFDCDLDALVYHMRRLSDDGLRALREKRSRAPLGAYKLQRMHPWMEPKTLAEPGGRPVPSFKIGARGLTGARMAAQGAGETHDFRRGHEVSRLGRLAADHDVEFPYGTYAMRVFHNVKVAEPLPGAIVAAPGPLLREVLAERSAADPARRIEVLDQVRTAWQKEAADVLALDALDFDHAPGPATSGKSKSVPASPPSSPRAGADHMPESSSPSAGGSAASTSDAAHQTGPRPEPRVRHRFDRVLDRGQEHPRRIITERDRRRGRPPGSSGSSGPSGAAPPG
jgi:hypothetical protein